MKPVSYHKIALGYRDLWQFHFGLLLLLSVTSGVFLVVGCQSQLCAKGNLSSAFGFAAVFPKLG